MQILSAEGIWNKLVVHSNMHNLVSFGFHQFCMCKEWLTARVKFALVVVTPTGIVDSQYSMLLFGKALHNILWSMQ